MHHRNPLDPGPVRGWWWRSSQAQRLAVAGVGAALPTVLLVGALLNVPTSAQPAWGPPPSGISLNPVETSDATTTPGSTSRHSATPGTKPSTTDATSTSSAPTTTPTTTTTDVAGPTTTVPTTTDTTTTVDDQPDIRVGRPCAPEGATAVTVQGQTVTCAVAAKGQLRWRKQ